MTSPSRPFPSAEPPRRPFVPDLHGDRGAVGERHVPRLWRSRTNRVFVGVLGGLAEKFGIEARPMRLLYGMSVMATFGVALVPYLAMWAITEAHGPRPLVPRFWRSRVHKVFSGMLGGLSEKWGVNPAVIRTLYAGVTVATGVIPGVLAYLVTWMATRPLEER